MKVHACHGTLHSPHILTVKHLSLLCLTVALLLVDKKNGSDLDGGLGSHDFHHSLANERKDGSDWMGEAADNAETKECCKPALRLGCIRHVMKTFSYLQYCGATGSGGRAGCPLIQWLVVQSLAPPLCMQVSMGNTETHIAPDGSVCECVCVCVAPDERVGSSAISV